MEANAVQTDVGWLKGGMKVCAARALYAELACAVGSWNAKAIARCISMSTHHPQDLEVVVDKIRKLRDGTRAPTLEGWAQIATTLPLIDLRRWIDYPLFRLLNQPQSKRGTSSDRRWTDYQVIIATLRLLPRDLQLRLEDARPLREAKLPFDIQHLVGEHFHQMIAAREFLEMPWADRLLAVTALGKLALWRGDRMLFGEASAWTLRNFAESVAKTPHLLAGWSWLAAAYENQLWRTYVAQADNYSQNFSPTRQDIERVLKAMNYCEARCADRRRTHCLDKECGKGFYIVPREFLTRYCGLYQGGPAGAQHEPDCD